MTKNTILALILLAIIILPVPTMAQLDHPNDYYAHAGIMSACGLVWNGIFSAPGPQPDQWVTRHPKLATFILCNGVGLLKEFAWDDRPDWRDIAANNAGIAGATLMFTIKW